MPQELPGLDDKITVILTNTSYYNHSVTPRICQINDCGFDATYEKAEVLLEEHIPERVTDSQPSF